MNDAQCKAMVNEMMSKMGFKAEGHDMPKGKMPNKMDKKHKKQGGAKHPEGMEK